MHLKAVISATSREEAEELCDKLLEENLIAGSLILEGDSRYHWKGEIVDETYFNVHAYTMERAKQEVIEKVREIHSDETPIVEYTEIDGNQDFINWIDRNIR
jgi:periplasmic divalent cation tolerance protein